jgi:CheY-like chemotaxis protein
MPRVSGIEFCTRLASTSAAKIPVVLMSSMPKKQLPKSIGSTVQVPYIQKPLTWEKFKKFALKIQAILHGEPPSDMSSSRVISQK